MCTYSYIIQYLDIINIPPDVPAIQEYIKQVVFMAENN